MNFRPIFVLNRRTFRQNKGRNLVAVLAIILTTLMFTTLFVLSQSMSRNMIEMTFRQTGYDGQVSFKSITEEQAAKIAAHPDVAETGYSMVVGIGQGKELSGRQVEIRFADESYAEHSFAKPVTGRMPQAADEIALDNIVLDKLGIPHELGQRVTLEWIADFQEEENRVSEFTLCGFWEGNESSYASMAWVSREFAEDVTEQLEAADSGAAEEVPDSRLAGICMGQVNLYSDREIEKTMDRILEDTGLTELEYGVNLAYDPDMNRMAAQESLPMYLGMILVFVAGYLIIYNIFQISVTTDIQFYGKLKTLGMTARQLKRLIYGQAGRLCLLGIPVGMVLGYLLGMVLVPVWIQMEDARVSVSPLIFIGSAAFAGMTVLISCMRPARMAGKVSPMEALRYNDVQRGGRSVKRRSGSAGLSALAWSNLGRNRKRTVTVICSLTLGLTLMSVFYARNAAFDMEKYLEELMLSDFQMDQATSEEYMKGYDPYGDTLHPELIAQVEALEGLEGIGYEYSHETEIALSEQTIANMQAFYTDDVLADWASYDPVGPQSIQEAVEEKSAGAVVYGLDGIVLDAYTAEAHVLAGSYDAEQFATGKYAIAAGLAMTKEEGQTLPTVSVGDTVEIEGQEYTIMAVLDEFSVVTEGAKEGGAENKDRHYLEFIVPMETFRARWPQNTPRKIFFDVEDAHLDAAQEMLDRYSAETGENIPLTTRASKAAQYRRETRSSAVMGNVVSIVIALVGVLNFVNSMVTSIVSRRKEFAMMQSVGMTKSQLCKLLVWEGMDYAWITLLCTYVISSLAVGIGVRAMVEGGFTTFRFTLLPLVICTPPLLLFAVLVPYLCFHNLEKDSLVERLRSTD
ncbi:MAG: FtsX-like permease family protein [Lachnospiraceae bacterium]|jgi:putative ABC transport system permease protein|nr:FtsX-like permease family protein [Lachnospiraceae bacterium]MCI9253468.1 FtsX-like permease family protein [Lachnospiraceae bacterium]